MGASIDCDRHALLPQAFARNTGERRRTDLAGCQRVGRDHRQAGAVGQHRQPLTLLRTAPHQRFHGIEQVFGGVHAQHAGAADGSVEHQVGAIIEILPYPRLEHDHRLGARRQPSGRHELARRAQVFHAQQDRLGGGIGGQVVEQVAEIDVHVVAQRDELRKADAALAGPVQHRPCQRA